MRPQDVRVRVYTEGMATSESILDKLKNRDTQIATALGLDPAEAGPWFNVDLASEFNVGLEGGWVEWNHRLFGKSAPDEAEIVYMESGSAFVTLRLSSADMPHETWRVIVAAEMAWRANFPNAGAVAIDD